jgi:hypothetical protein
MWTFVLGCRCFVPPRVPVVAVTLTVCWVPRWVDDGVEPISDGSVALVTGVEVDQGTAG